MSTPKADLRDGLIKPVKQRATFRDVFISTFVRGALGMYGLAAIIEPARHGWRIFSDANLRPILIWDAVGIHLGVLVIALLCADREVGKQE